MALFRRRPRTAAIQRGQPGIAGFGLNPRTVAQPWQERARFFSRHMGLVRFVFQLRAELASRCLLVPEITDNGHDWSAQPDDPVLADVLASYRGPRESQRDLVKRHVWLYGTIGEAMQVLLPDGGWTIRDPSTLVAQGDGFLVKDTPNGRAQEGTAFAANPDTVTRLWLPDETWPGLATSELAGALIDCERYWDTGRAIRRLARSRLTQSGGVFTPEEAHQPALMQGQPGFGRYSSAFERDWTEAASRMLDDVDETDPAAVAPVLFRWPSQLGKPEHLSFARPHDTAILAYRTEAREDVARSLPMPTQLILEGPGAGGNHWGDWLADEKSAGDVAGILDVVAKVDITETQFRPALRARVARGEWAGDPERVRVGYDVTPITVHPDRSTISIDLAKLGFLAIDRALEENRWNPATDRATEDDLALIERLMLSRGSQPVDATTVNPAPPAGARAALRPYPAELAAWRS